MTGIWNRLISLDGWVSNPPANDRGREWQRERERERGETLFILPRPDGEGSFGAARPLCPSGRDTHTHKQTQLPQPVCTAVVLSPWWPKPVRLIRLIFYLSLWRYHCFKSQRVAGIKRQFLVCILLVWIVGNLFFCVRMCVIQGWGEHKHVLKHYCVETFLRAVLTCVERSLSGTEMCLVATCSA